MARKQTQYELIDGQGEVIATVARKNIAETRYHGDANVAYVRTTAGNVVIGEAPHPGWKAAAKSRPLSVVKPEPSTTALDGLLPQKSKPAKAAPTDRRAKLLAKRDAKLDKGTKPSELNIDPHNALKQMLGLSWSEYLELKVSIADARLWLAAIEASGERDPDKLMGLRKSA